MTLSSAEDLDTESTVPNQLLEGNTAYGLEIDGFNLVAAVTRRNLSTVGTGISYARAKITPKVTNFVYLQ